MPTFRAQLIRGKGTTMGFEVPAEVVASLGSSRRPPVTVTINGYTYRNTVAVMGGVYMIGVAKEHRQPAGIADQVEVDVTLELDTAERWVEMPEDFAAALSAAPAAKARFESLSYSAQRQHTLAIAAAKTPETRSRRIAKVVDLLAVTK